MTSVELPPPPPPQPKTPQEPPESLEQPPSITTAIPNAPPDLPSHLAISPITTPNQLSQFRRINTLLLPIRYPDSFYNAILSPAQLSSLSLIATYTPQSPSPPVVVGGICCRLEDREAPGRQDGSNSEPTTTTTKQRQLYILTLCILAPYRRLGLASHLLEQMISRALVAEDGVSDVYAHVWEANEEARRWYSRRGFGEEEGRVEGYYRRLKPQGAVVVRRNVRIGVI
ncbi:hypothetical protein GP486_004743 [Trichoglossum hirsutum]|uniref:N-acetyltransferase domain-containing protein n=1 Tax=Trichoglossum hirsutum TaxID=265104 RepID=A0A9P8LAQ1_9PEZI|nr:hypothetical protein GP486_004743 [Trichoglossum hirsutum]